MWQVIKGHYWQSKRDRRWIGLLLVALLLGIQVVHLSAPGQLRFVTRLNYLLYDVRFNILPPQRAAPVPIIIVDLDEFSIQREGRWPWDRRKIAQLVDNLQADGAALIGLDMIFSEASRNPVAEVMQQGRLTDQQKQQLAKLKPQFNSDQVLADAIGRNVVLGYFLQDNKSSAGQLPFPFYRLSAAQQQHNSLLAMSHYTGNIPVLANHALAQGFVVAVPDLDGVVRRVPLVLRYKKGVYASLSLAMAQLALGAHWIKLEMADNGSSYVVTGVNIGNRAHVPLSADGTLLVPYKGYAGSFPTISATRVLRGDMSDKARRQLQGAIVLVGTSALGLSDLRTVPLQTAYPGVEVHANVLDAILQAALGANTFYQQPAWSPGFSLLLLFLVGGILALWLPGRSVLWLLVSGLAAEVLVVALNLWLWQGLHLALPVSLQLLLVALLLAFNLVIGFVETSQSKRQVEGLFGEYVPPDYVKLMLSNPEKASMEGEQRDMTVLFADVCSFTTLSESLSTNELKRLLNRYLTEVTGVIFDNKGTIDKYVGDMVMAFWNAPLDDDQHAQHGVETALAMQQKVAALRDIFPKEGLPPVAVGIGLNSGPMNVGDMGSSYRRAYTVLGDAVNLGSRLEGLTRFYGIDILVSEDTANQCHNILFRPIDRIRVKGKHEPVDVFEPVCLEAEASDSLRDDVTTFARALAVYRDRDFSQAKTILTGLLAKEDDRAVLYRCYLDRIDAFETSPPPDDWQAVFTHTSK